MSIPTLSSIVKTCESHCIEFAREVAEIQQEHKAISAGLDKVDESQLALLQRLEAIENDWKRKGAIEISAAMLDRYEEQLRDLTTKVEMMDSCFVDCTAKQRRTSDMQNATDQNVDRIENELSVASQNCKDTSDSIRSTLSRVQDTLHSQERKVQQITSDPPDHLAKLNDLKKLEMALSSLSSKLVTINTRLEALEREGIGAEMTTDILNRMVKLEEEVPNMRSTLTEFMLDSIEQRHEDTHMSSDTPSSFDSSLLSSSSDIKLGRPMLAEDLQCDASHVTLHMHDMNEEHHPFWNPLPLPNPTAKDALSMATSCGGDVDDRKDKPYQYIPPRFLLHSRKIMGSLRIHINQASRNPDVQRCAVTVCLSILLIFSSYLLQMGWWETYSDDQLPIYAALKRRQTFAFFYSSIFIDTLTTCLCTWSSLHTIPSLPRIRIIRIVAWLRIHQSFPTRFFMTLD